MNILSHDLPRGTEVGMKAAAEPKRRDNATKRMIARGEKRRKGGE